MTKLLSKISGRTVEGRDNRLVALNKCWLNKLVDGVRHLVPFVRLVLLN